MMSSFSGKIKEFPQISVDRFDGRNLASTAYFLSHAHTDHMIGLGSPQFLDHLESNSGVYLYCSQITARFLQASIRYRPLSPFIFPLPLEKLVKINVPNVAEEATHQLWVTLIQAAHCPGSVMFLFEGRGGTVLYTGDFRISVGDAARLAPLHNSDGTVKVIDSLHIDTTFCHRDIMHFPSREESAQAVAEAIEDWLARGNNFLIHLICPAKYGYEFIYRSLHDRFGMKIHVCLWKYRMYDTVPEIQDVLTLDATVTWIHSCENRTKNEEEASERSRNRLLPCRCVPYGVTTDPNIRVIKPSALFYTIYQSAKEIKQISTDGTFCRVLLSMHASCSEVLDMVSYLRPRKVFPNVIPSNSTKEEVLKLLHEALNRSGDHYSIEYGGSNRSSLGSFKRQLHSSECSSNGGSTSSSSNSSMLDTTSLLDVYLSSPNKRRRHSDSNMTLVLPTPRGNMKGSLSLEGETRHDITNDDSSQPSTSSSALKRSPKLSHSDSVVDTGDELEWKDPFSPSPFKSQHHFFQSSTETCIAEPLGIKRDMNVDFSISTEKDEDASAQGRKRSLNGRDESVDRREAVLARKLADDIEDGDEETDSVRGMLRMDVSQMNQDSVEASVFSEEGDRESTLDLFENNSRPPSVAASAPAGESSTKQSRKMWYKHKYFSTPVHDEVDKNWKPEMKPGLGIRSSSLPLPESCRDDLVSPDFFASTDGDKNLPLITVSSPSDQASESQVSDETNVTVVLSSGEPSESDILFSEELPSDNSVLVDNGGGGTSNSATSSSPVRPSVICSPPKPDGFSPLEVKETAEIGKSTSLDETRKSGGTGSVTTEWFDPHNIGWIDCNKKRARGNGKQCIMAARGSVVESRVKRMIYKTSKSESDSLSSAKNNAINFSPDLVDLVSDSDCMPDLSQDISSQSSKDSVLSSRSSCLKTVRRTQDHVEVVTLDHHPL